MVATRISSGLAKFRAVLALGYCFSRSSITFSARCLGSRYISGVFKLIFSKKPDDLY